MRQVIKMSDSQMNTMVASNVIWCIDVSKTVSQQSSFLKSNISFPLNTQQSKHTADEGCHEAWILNFNAILIKIMLQSSFNTTTKRKKVLSTQNRIFLFFLTICTQCWYRKKFLNTVWFSCKPNFRQDNNDWTELSTLIIAYSFVIFRPIIFFP